MKRILLLTALSLTLFSFAVIAAGSYTIKGTAAGVPDGTRITIGKPNDKGAVVIVDSAKVNNGSFTFTGVVPEPAIHLIEIANIEGKVAFVLEEGNISLNLYKDSISKSNVGGTRSNDDLQKFNQNVLKVQKKMNDFQTVNLKQMSDAQANKDTAVINSLMSQYEKIQDELMVLTATFPENNPNSFLSVLFIDNMFNNPEADIVKIKTIYSKLDPKLKATTPGRKIQEKIDNFRDVAVGSMAPDFSAPTPEGKTASLKSAMGKITIIDFWASWCGPCRRENPSVVALYNEYHPKGLNIIGVSLDKDGKKWTDAIAKDGLTWTHVSNLQFWQDPIAKMYNITSIPATFILDANGKIIARDLRGDALHAKVKELLDK